MKLSYFHVAEDVPSNLIPKVAVVVDVLRATTTIACALNNGAEGVQAFSDLHKLKKDSSNWPASTRLLLGERGGKRLEGFDLGNSPVDVLPEVVKGKRLFMSTTNGTKALDRVKNSNVLYTMALINRRAVAEKLLTQNYSDILILGSGWEGSYSLEDSLAAGSLASFLIESGSDSIDVVNDELHSALALWSYWKDDLLGCLHKATHGKRLKAIGNHDEDFACCSDLDKIEVVPTQSAPGVLCSA
tara:strand:+ start:194 stop:925 length:732 start_codon:yes stop_codon:yes gene_type:complete